MAVELTADLERLKAGAEGRRAFKARPVYQARTPNCNGSARWLTARGPSRLRGCGNVSPPST